jgi:hypothetical protein
MSVTTKRARRLAGLCTLCVEPVREQGQRGWRSEHYHCRKLADAGYSAEAIRRIRAQQRVESSRRLA